ncbi:hypothetical protein C8R47DRAFT_1074219 [Mycena vitilis]|nr:hypothetical protein C8R47DRAFT_1074219 [Mycena vitilis]
MLLIARVMVRLEAWLTRLTRLSWMRDSLTTYEIRITCFIFKTQQPNDAVTGRSEVCPSFVPHRILDNPVAGAGMEYSSILAQDPEGNMAAVGIVSTLDLVISEPGLSRLVLYLPPGSRDIVLKT